MIDTKERIAIQEKLLPILIQNFGVYCNQELTEVSTIKTNVDTLSFIFPEYQLACLWIYRNNLINIPPGTDL